MEQQIESYIDNFLDNIALQLHMFNITFGVILIIGGSILLIRTRKDKFKMIGFFSVVIGVLGVLTNFIKFI